MEETFSKILRLLADAKTDPAADLETLINIETVVLQALRSPQDFAVAQAGQSGAAPGPMNGGAPPMMPQAPPGTPAGGLPMPGMASGMGNPDELRRMLNQG